MSNNFILDFPVWQQDCADFAEGVSYEVEASRIDGNLKIDHKVKGQSFIRQLIKNGDAMFSISLFYRDSSERQSHLCNTDQISINDRSITATQTIPMDFSYAPEISPSIIILENKKITVDDSSGLTDFWGKGEHFYIPAYSRIVIGRKLKFTSGNVSKLMEVEFDKTLGPGEMKVIVNELAGEGETPVSLKCGQDVYNELHKITLAEPKSAVDAMRLAIITQALCAVYAYMHNLSEDCEVGGVLAAHLEMLERETQENWNHEDFDPSLAATKMQPYAITALHNETDND